LEGSNIIFREKQWILKDLEKRYLLFNNDLVHNYADLYKLTVEQILPLERMAQNLPITWLKGWRFKNIPFERVLYALGIRYVGETVRNWRNIIKILMH
jgi:NAD-dependent DNA ligase